MYFDAKINKKEFSVNVEETRTHWVVSLERKDKESFKTYEISKKDFIRAEGDVISFIFKNRSYLMDIYKKDDQYSVFTQGSHRLVEISNDEIKLRESLKGNGGLGGGSQIKSGMPGKIVKVLVEEGQIVKQGTPILIMEAMKMENEIRSSGDAKVSKIHVSTGDSVESGALLVSFSSVED